MSMGNPNTGFRESMRVHAPAKAVTIKGQEFSPWRTGIPGELDEEYVFVSPIEDRRFNADLRPSMVNILLNTNGAPLSQRIDKFLAEEYARGNLS